MNTAKNETWFVSAALVCRGGTARQARTLALDGSGTPVMVMVIMRTMMHELTTAAAWYPPSSLPLAITMYTATTPTATMSPMIMLPVRAEVRRSRSMSLEHTSVTSAV